MRLLFLPPTLQPLIFVDMKRFDFNNPVARLSGDEFLPVEGVIFADQVLAFLTEKIPEIAASSLVRGSNTASPQSRGIVAKVLSFLLNSK